MKYRRTMTSEVRRAREMRAERRTYDEIAAELDRGTCWIRKHAKDVPGARRRTTKLFTEDRDRGRYMFRNGVPKAAIARQLGRAYGTVKAWCRDIQIAPGLSMAERAVRAHEAGMSNKEIAHLVGYKSGKVVRAVLSRARRQKREAAE